jgi:hypothetical protein
MERKVCMCGSDSGQHRHPTGGNRIDSREKTSSDFSAEINPVVIAGWTVFNSVQMRVK